MKLTIIGFGLIGSSIARAAKSVNPNTKVQAIDTRTGVSDVIAPLNICEDICSKLGDIWLDADFIILAAPVGEIIKDLPAVLSSAGSQTIVTDVGSVKSEIVNAATAAAPNFDRFVPAHPMAGRHLSGPENGAADLFDGCRVILTPYDGVSAQAIKKTTEFFNSIGAAVSSLTPGEHDHVMAYVSHLPHFLAFAYMNLGRSMTERGMDYGPFYAGGFRDFTRIAQSDPKMWADIFKYNKAELLRCLDNVEDFISTLATDVRLGNEENIMATLTEARDERSRFDIDE